MPGIGAAELGLDRDVYDLNLTASYELTPELTFTTVNGYRKFDSLEIFDADGSAAWYLEFAELAKGWQASHEGRFAYRTDKIRASFGWNFFTEDNIQNVPFSAEEGIFLQCAARVIPGLPCIDSSGVVQAAKATSLATGGLLNQVPYSSEFENQGRNDSYSVFADTTWTPVPALELTGGVRLLIEKRESGYFARVPRPVLNPTATSLIPGQVDTGGQTFVARESYSAVLPRFNVLFRASDAVNLFATVSKGRRSPVVQLSATRVGGQPAPNLQLVPEEKVWNYEVGLKGRAGPLSGSLGVYYQKYDGFGDIDDGQVVFGNQLRQVIEPRHFAVFAHDRADHRGIAGAGTADQFDRGFQRGRALGNAARRRNQREHMARRNEIVAAGGGIDGHGNGAGPVGSGNAGRHAGARFDRAAVRAA